MDLDWSTVKEGDDDPTPNDGELGCCTFQWETVNEDYPEAGPLRFFCTREPHDDGIHVAGTSVSVAAVLKEKK